MHAMYTIAAYFVHEELYTSSLQNIIDNFLHYYFHREKQVQLRRLAESREMTFPFLIFTGSLESHDTIYLAADKHIICDFEASLVESALALLATSFYV